MFHKHRFIIQLLRGGASSVIIHREALHRFLSTSDLVAQQQLTTSNLRLFTKEPKLPQSPFAIRSTVYLDLACLILWSACGALPLPQIVLLSDKMPLRIYLCDQYNHGNRL